MLRLERVVAGYGPVRVLDGVDLAVEAGEAVALMGRNGMGKTTAVRAIFALLRPTAGRRVIAGRDMTAAPPHAVARAGLGLVPEGRQVFPGLSVAENLVATARPGRWDRAAVEELFPRLAERRRQPAARLSGGEQQMLAIGRALTTNPRVLVLDEATEGLAPMIRAEIWATLARLRAEGLGILVVDKDLAALRGLCDRAVVLEKGAVAWRGDAAAMAAEAARIETFLHL